MADETVEAAPRRWRARVRVLCFDPKASRAVVVPKGEVVPEGRLSAEDVKHLLRNEHIEEAGAEMPTAETAEPAETVVDLPALPAPETVADAD